MQKKQITIKPNSKISLKGEIFVSSDKSCSHRALILASQMMGVTKITGLLEAEDVLATKKALQYLGVEIYKEENDYFVKGNGFACFSSPKNILDLQNSGTGVRLLMGLVATINGSFVFTGDDSLVKRPMARVLKPLEKFAVDYQARENNFLPITIIGNDEATAIKTEVAVPSAQVKSALLLAAINAYGKSTIIEPVLTRDHTEIMMEYLGFEIEVEMIEGKKHISLNAQEDLPAKDITVSGDPSSATFLAALALLSKDSQITLKNILFNQYRTGFFEIVEKMGAKISYDNERIISGEKVVDITLKTSILKAINIPAEIASKTIDEYPILAIVASKAKGITRMNGLKELKVKESNRFLAIIENLQKCGVKTNNGDDWLEIEGTEKLEVTDIITTYHDHRIAMSFIVLALAFQTEIVIDDITMINTSFPEFFDKLQEVGVDNFIKKA